MVSIVVCLGYCSTTFASEQVLQVDGGFRGGDDINECLPVFCICLGAGPWSTWCHISHCWKVSRAHTR